MTPTEDRETAAAKPKGLVQLQGPAAFVTHFLALASAAQRQIDILTDQLDPLLFANTEICDQLSRLARRHRQTQIRILIKHPKPLFGHNHRLINLQQRLPSKIHLRQLKLEPNNPNTGYIIADGHQLLLQHKEGMYDGFCNTAAAAECRTLLEEFNQLWQRQSAEILELRPLSL